MGSWSVYCGISNIVITAGQPCVVLPLKKNDNYSCGYFRYLPATPPIFGNYDDYGGIEDIEDTPATKLIEDHFKIDIHSFCQYFTRGIITKDEDDFPKSLDTMKEMNGWEFMFIDRKVYDFMTTHIAKGNYGKLNMGSKEILNLLGFEYIGENLDNPTYDPKRYKYHWRFQNQDFYSDGTWLHCGKNGIHHISGSYKSGALSTYVKIPKDKEWIKKMTTVKLWKYLSEADQYKYLGYVLGVDSMMLTMVKLLKNAPRSGNEDIFEIYESTESTISYKVITNVELFGDMLADLTTMHHNLHPLSMDFAPYVPYLTPQCGEREESLKIEQTFCKIAKSYIRKEDY